MSFRKLASFAVLLLVCAAQVKAEETAKAPDAETLAAAREMIEVTGVSKQIDGMIASVSKGIAASGADKNAAGKEMSSEFEAFMKKFASYKTDMLNDFALLYAQSFTAAEMKEVSNFYRSGTGAKFIASMPALMQKGAEIGVKYSRKLMEDAAAEKKK